MPATTGYAEQTGLIARLIKDVRRLQRQGLNTLRDVDPTGLADGAGYLWHASSSTFLAVLLSRLVENVNTVSTSGSAQTIPDVTVATMNRITLTTNCALTFPTPAAGKSFTLKLIQDGTGSRTVTWPSSSLRRFDSGTTPTLSTAAGSIDTFACVCDDGTKWDVYFAGKGMT